MKTIFANADAGMLGLLFFFCVFMGIAIWTLTPKRKETIESHRNIPLNEDEDHDR
jgi:cbb3-type cytochrome oxidase subunit 3